MLDVTAKLGKGFRGTCCKIRQNLYQDSEYFGKESRSFEAAQAYLVPWNKVDKVVAAGIFLA
ncbi:MULTISPECIES: hypothetical protein [Phocaeicola]|jgi:hypothetical protein|uniref:hypothetical protein n=1 Tax=Phocaeicola TaxID=909656 RepID=UPI0015FC3DED|nr:hypothetical protein [Phocaeicola vulgatus]